MQRFFIKRVTRQVSKRISCVDQCELGPSKAPASLFRRISDQKSSTLSKVGQFSPPPASITSNKPALLPHVPIFPVLNNGHPLPGTSSPRHKISLVALTSSDHLTRDDGPNLAVRYHPLCGRIWRTGPD